MLVDQTVRGCEHRRIHKNANVNAGRGGTDHSTIIVRKPAWSSRIELSPLQGIALLHTSKHTAPPRINSLLEPSLLSIADASACGLKAHDHSSNSIADVNAQINLSRR